MAASKATMGCGKASFQLLYSQFLRRSAIPGIHSGSLLRDSFGLLPKAPHSIDSISMSDLRLVNFSPSIRQQLFAEPFLGQSIVEARRGVSSEEDLEDHEVVDDFDDDDDEDDFEDSSDDEEFATCSDEDEDADESGRIGHGVRGKFD